MSFCSIILQVILLFIFLQFNSLELLTTLSIKAPILFPARAQHTATYVGNGKIIVIAGIDKNTNALSDVWELLMKNSTTAVWIPISPLKNSFPVLAGHSSTFDFSNAIVYVSGGGNAGGKPSNSAIWSFNSQTSKHNYIIPKTYLQMY